MRCAAHVSRSSLPTHGDCAFWTYTHYSGIRNARGECARMRSVGTWLRRPPSLPPSLARSSRATRAPPLTDPPWWQPATQRGAPCPRRGVRACRRRCVVEPARPTHPAPAAPPRAVAAGAAPSTTHSSSSSVLLPKLEDTSEQKTLSKISMAGHVAMASLHCCLGPMTPPLVPGAAVSSSSEMSVGSR